MPDLDHFRGPLAAEQDYVLAQQPEDPELRESVSLWLFEDTGEFAIPRSGIEAVGANWDAHRFDVNVALAGGRVLRASSTGPVHDPLDAQGRPTRRGAGPLLFECVAPFLHWRASFDGEAADGDVATQVDGGLDPSRTVPVAWEADLRMATPAWVQDNRSETLAKLDAAAAAEAAFMGVGYRFEQLLRASGTLRLDGAERPFTGTGLRIHRQSVRPLGGFRGHCWQSALFPDGRAFGYIAYPDREDGTPGYNAGYVYANGKIHAARAVTIPWLRALVGEGDDVSLELESDLGRTRIEGVSTLSTFRIGNPDLGGLNLSQGGARYSWDGQQALGMIERSSHESLTRRV